MSSKFDQIISDVQKEQSTYFSQYEAIIQSPQPIMQKWKQYQSQSNQKIQQVLLKMMEQYPLYRPSLYKSDIFYLLFGFTLIENSISNQNYYKEVFLHEFQKNNASQIFPQFALGLQKLFDQKNQETLKKIQILQIFCNSLNDFRLQMLAFFKQLAANYSQGQFEKKFNELEELDHSIKSLAKVFKIKINFFKIETNNQILSYNLENDTIFELNFVVDHGNYQILYDMNYSKQHYYEELAKNNLIYDESHSQIQSIGQDKKQIQINQQSSQDSQFIIKLRPDQQLFESIHEIQQTQQIEETQDQEKLQYQFETNKPKPIPENYDEQKQYEQFNQEMFDSQFQQDIQVQQYKNIEKQTDKEIKLSLLSLHDKHWDDEKQQYSFLSSSPESKIQSQRTKTFELPEEKNLKHQQNILQSFQQYDSSIKQCFNCKNSFESNLIQQDCKHFICQKCLVKQIVIFLFLNPDYTLVKYILENEIYQCYCNQNISIQKIYQLFLEQNNQNEFYIKEQILQYISDFKQLSQCSWCNQAFKINIYSLDPCKHIICHECYQILIAKIEQTKNKEKQCCKTCNQTIKLYYSAQKQEKIDQYISNANLNQQIIKNIRRYKPTICSCNQKVMFKNQYGISYCPNCQKKICFDHQQEFSNKKNCGCYCSFCTKSLINDDSLKAKVCIDHANQGFERCYNCQKRLIFQSNHQKNKQCQCRRCQKCYQPLIKDIDQNINNLTLIKQNYCDTCQENK